MTQHQAFPLRGGPAWPGTNSLGGKLDDGSGQLSTNSKNIIINVQDTLAKRKGFIRGLDEQFMGPVCGLHSYTDECGIEYLLVADEEMISIREPYKIPVFEVSDAYPNDAFNGTTTSVDLGRWRDPSLGYRHELGQLVLKSGVSNPEPLEWFKEAESRSYEVRAPFNLPNEAPTQFIDLHIKSSTGSGNGSLRLRLANSAGILTATLAFIDLSGTEQEITIGNLPGASVTGDVRTFRYDADTRRVSAIIFQDGVGTPATVEGTLSAIQDADLGQKSLVKLFSTKDPATIGLTEISSEPI